MQKTSGARTLTGGVLVLAIITGSGLVAAPAASGGEAPLLPIDTVSSAAEAQVGDLLEVRLDQLRPTQPAVGWDQVRYKLGRYASENDERRGEANLRFDDWCEANGQEEADVDSIGPDSTLTDPSTFGCTVAVGEETEDSLSEVKTVVLGPGDVIHMTDGHHTMTSLFETADGGAEVPVRMLVTDDFSDLAPEEFWTTMRERSLVWLVGPDGEEITPEELPRGVGFDEMGDDPYRSLVYFTRNVGYSVPDGAPEFLEFFWGAWLRPQIDLADYDLDRQECYLKAIERASNLMLDAPADTEIAPGRSAAALGQLPEFNDGEPLDEGRWGELTTPITDPAPGRLAYAVQARTAG